MNFNIGEMRGACAKHPVEARTSLLGSFDTTTPFGADKLEPFQSTKRPSVMSQDASPPPFDCQDKEVIRTYWEDRLPQTWYSKKDQETLEYYNEVEQERYGYHYPFLLQDAEFTEHSGEKVLEIGCGIGTDSLKFAKGGASCGATWMSFAWNKAESTTACTSGRSSVAAIASYVASSGSPDKAK